MFARNSLAARPNLWVATLLSVVSLILNGPIAKPALAAAQPPIGHERWANPEPKSGVDFGLTATQVFEKYAASFTIGLPQEHKQKDKRLIDIEVRSAGGGLGSYVYDVVWVKNEGSFQAESWFVTGFTEAELHQLPQLASQKIVAVDVERYPQDNEWRYSMILQRNTGKFGFEILTNASWTQVQDAASRGGLRVLDLDYASVGSGVLSCPHPSIPSGQACAPSKFDAILVANSGSNQIETKVWFNLTEAQIIDKAEQGYQIIDHERPVTLPSSSMPIPATTVWVKPGSGFNYYANLSHNDVIHHHGHHGRVVDLERSNSQTTPYSSINLP